MRKGKKWKGISLGLLGIGSSFLLSAGVLGYWKQTGNTLNILSTAVFQNKIVEEYKVLEPVFPGDEVDKLVNVKNTGNVDSFVRVAVKKVFGRTKEDGTFLADPSLDPGMIDIAVSDTWWNEREDGYFYYKEVLKPGKTTREPLMRSYKLSKEAGNEYQGKEARIVVTMESMQADMDPEKIWGVSSKTLGFQIEKVVPGKQTQVIYAGKNGGFQISESSTDLFSSFKMLTPGCGRTQSISVENHSQETVEILLRAEEADQAVASEKQREQIRKFLEQDAVIRIKNGSQELYHGPVAAGLLSGSSNMNQDISLGIFEGNTKKNLIVTLEVNPNMDSQAGNLTGKVRWIFTAKGGDNATISAQSVPRTGDYTNIAFWILLLLGSIGVMIGSSLIISVEGWRSNDAIDSWDNRHNH